MRFYAQKAFVRLSAGSRLAERAGDFTTQRTLTSAFQSNEDD
jgi:hypothetical protein